MSRLCEVKKRGGGFGVGFFCFFLVATFTISCLDLREKENQQEENAQRFLVRSEDCIFGCSLSSRPFFFSLFFFWPFVPSASLNVGCEGGFSWCADDGGRVTSTGKRAPFLPSFLPPSLLPDESPFSLSLSPMFPIAKKNAGNGGGEGGGGTRAIFNSLKPASQRTTFEASPFPLASPFCVPFPSLSPPPLFL